MRISEKLQRLLKTHNKTAVAKAAGIHPNTLLLILSGKGISLHTASALAGVLGVSVGWLVDDAQGWGQIVRVPPVENYQSSNHLEPATAA
jgi:transcriptional regulator with XRE-family HTH domain